MAKKKIVIEDKPEETEAEAPATASASTTDETETSSPEADTSATDGQPEVEVEQSADEPTPEADASSEEPLEAVPSQVDGNDTVSQPMAHRRRYQLIAISIMLILVLTGVYLLLRPSNPLPKADTKLAKFQVYYPKSNSSGYVYAAGSAAFTAGQLTYSLEPKNNHVGAGGPIIRVTEQALQGQGPNLNALTNFTLLKEPAGNAAIGNNGAIVNGVIVTKKTLIIINGIDGASKQDVLTIMKSM